MKKTILSMLVASAIFASASANAEPVVSWQIDVNAEFSNAKFLPTGSTQNTSTLLEWGAGPYSQLYLTDSITRETIFTDGASQDNFGLFHVNNVLRTGYSLLSVDINTTLRLSAISPSGVSPNPVFEKTFKVSFTETLNDGYWVGTQNYCPNGELNYQGVNVRGCADIFTIDGTAFDQEFFYNTSGSGFGDTNGDKYYLSFFNQLGNLSPLSDAACDSVGLGAGCLGFMSPEQRTNSTIFAAMITSVPSQVPEPGTLALMGIALGGLSLYRRRKKS
jgi:hypothetical protein